jgi:hypothetical protein
MAIEDGEKGVDFAAEVVHEGMFPRFAVSFAVNRVVGLGESRIGGSWGDERRRWDSNPRELFTLHDFQSCSLGHYETPPRGGESGIRTHEGYSPYRFSRAAHSTTLTSLRGPV